MENERLARWEEGIEIRVDVAETPRIRGYAAVFDAPTELWEGYQEVVRPGAFADSLERGDEVVALFNHDPNWPLGSRAAGTARVWEDDHGLAFEIEGPFSAEQEGRVLHPIRRGDIRGASFGFRAIDAPEDVREGKVIRELRRVDLLDVSPVTFPAYEATLGTVKARQEARALDFGHRLGQIDRKPVPRAARLRELEILGIG